MIDQRMRITGAPRTISSGIGISASEAPSGLAASYLPWPITGWAHLAWVPIPLFLMVMILLRINHIEGAFEPPYLLTILNFTFCTTVSLVVAFLGARSYLTSGSLSVLLLGAGMFTFGSVSLIASILINLGQLNDGVTVYNIGMVLTGICHLLGAVSGLVNRSDPKPRQRILLPWVYGAALAVVLMVSIGAHEGIIPLFFIQGEGATPMRQAVLSLGIGLLALSALILIATFRKVRSAYLYWYGLSLGLIATGLFGVLIIQNVGSVLGWMGRSAQYLGGIYMLFAIFAAFQETRSWVLPLEEALRQTEAALEKALAEMETRVQERTGELERRAAQLARLSSELTLAEHRERQRIAQILHDHLQQLLVSAQMRLQILSRRIDPAHQELAAQIKEVIDESIAASRSLTIELAPPALRADGLGAGMEWLAQWFEEKQGLKVDLSLDREIPAVREDVKLLLFESVREAIFNVVKHAGVDRISLRLKQMEDETLRITIIDQGIGFDIEQLKSKRGEKEGGYGIFSIQERLGLMGGELTIESEPGLGTCLTLSAPLTRPKRSH